MKKIKAQNRQFFTTKNELKKNIALNSVQGLKDYQIMKKAQNLLEYILIFMIVAVAGYVISTKVNLNNIKSYVFTRPLSSSDRSKIEIEAMTK